jgi:hypothetical protein
MTLDTAWRLVREAPGLALVVGIGALAFLAIVASVWMEERRLRHLWAIADKRDALLRERDRLWRDGP